MTVSTWVRRTPVLVSVALALMAATAARAHHSFAMYENEHQIKLKGKVTNFQWTNPHVYIDLEGVDVNSEKKETKSWVIECANPGILNRVGWKFNMIKTGDELTVIVAPMRSGEPGALLKEVTLPDGRVFSNGGPAGPALIH
ncbi:MAG TPA: DUF6152 family protein [Gammaproteobacteria bacterium]|nr:DUF6152 family protein [Gammaproteobacteria bacterium]